MLRSVVQVHPSPPHSLGAGPKKDRALFLQLENPDCRGEHQYREIMRNMADFKVDMKAEIGRMNDKITKMEDLMTDFLGKLNSALPKAASASSGTTPALTPSGDEAEAPQHRHHHHHHRRRHHRADREGKSRSRSRSKNKGGSGGESSNNIAQMLEDEVNGGRRSPRGEKSPSGSGGIKFVPGQREEFL